MHLLYPNSPLSRLQADDQFAAEVDAVRSAGFRTSLFSLEDLQSGKFRATAPVPTEASVLYRGWMLSGSEYEVLASALTRSGARPVVSTAAYLDSHHLPNWYPLIKDLTPETRIYPLDCDLEAELRVLNWPEYFIKDFVKSLKTSLGLAYRSLSRFHPSSPKCGGSEASYRWFLHPAC